MTDAIENFVAWYQSLPQAAQIGIPVAGAAGVFLIARHKGASGSQVFGPTSGSSQGGGGTDVGPPNPTPVIAPGPPSPGSPPPVPSPGGIYRPPFHNIKPTGSGSSGSPIIRPTTPINTKALTLSGPNKGPIVAPYTYPVSFGKPLPGASHPIYTGQGNAYVVNGQDIAHSGLPPKIRPHTQIGPTPTAQQQHVKQSDTVSKPASTEQRQHNAVARAFNSAKTPPSVSSAAPSSAALAARQRAAEAAAYARSHPVVYHQQAHPPVPPPPVYHQRKPSPIPTGGGTRRAF